MNRQYTYIDGKVVIEDENGIQRQEEYYDNLDEALVQENVIEESEKRLKKLQKEISEFKDKKYIPYPLIASFIAIVLTPLITAAFSSVNPFTEQIGTIIGNMNLASFMTTIMASWLAPVGLVLNYFERKKHEHRKKSNNGKKKEVKYLQYQLGIDKKKLAELKSKRTKKYENKELHKMVIDDSREMDALDTILEVYFDQGYYEDDEPSKEERKVYAKR